MHAPIQQETWAIEAIGLSKSFGNKPVLQDLQLNVVSGEFLVVLGDSGCGKSTLLKLITGLESPQSGSIRIHGTDQSRIAAHRRDVAMVFQDGNGYDHLTVRKNLNLMAKHSCTPSQMAEWVDRLRIGHTLEQRLDQLSGGELQRAAIARAMLTNKSIVLLDEPLSHLNQALREEIRDLLITVHRETKKTFVYVTHDSDEAFYLANRIAILAEGKILQVGEPRSIYRNSIFKRVAQLLGQPSIDILSLPRRMVDELPTQPDELIECGLRCHDWTIRHISVDAFGNETRVGDQLTVTPSDLVLRGAVHSCKWLGNRWLLGVECHGKLRIVCESAKEGAHESALLQAEQLTKTHGRDGQAIGTVEAYYPRSLVQWFKSS